VSRKTLQARSEQALVVVILSTGALIAYLGLALSQDMRGLPGKQQVA
jgi:hypothetical protein